ncbi:phenylacetate--CoA ligase family protein [Modestobacter sp. I12A-02662]|uniref:phenylacetate--CoA ligase family protein n=1 Tax=Modestobacter sp. I12A-02662 TaxID=1730496 RepID=UPI0034DEA347
MADQCFDPEIETRPWPELLTWQRDRLPGQLSRLAETVPLFQERLAGLDIGQAGSPGAWSAVPFTTKDDLRAAQADAGPEQPLGALQAVPMADVVQVLASSGTTGTPVFFGLTEPDRQAWLHSIATMFFTAGVRPTSRVALTTGMPLVAGGLPYADAVRHIGATLVWVGGQTPARTATILDRLGVDTFIGTASYATFAAARFGEALGRPAAGTAMRTIIAGGEPGLGEATIRDQLAREWGAARISEIMGLGDVMPGLWAECPEGGGMHFTGGRHVFVELIDPADGSSVPWEDDAHGEAVYTPFTRQATPVVRFRSRDHLRVQSRRCPCGRTSPRIRCVGRTDDMLIYKAMNVFPSAIREVVLDEYAAHVAGPMRIRKQSATQVRFDDPLPLEVELARPPSDAGALRQRIEESIRERLRVRVAVELLDRGSIPVGEYKNALTYVREETGRP